MKKTTFLIIFFLQFKYLDKTTTSIYTLMEFGQIDLEQRDKKENDSKKIFKRNLNTFNFKENNSRIFFQQKK